MQHIGHVIMRTGDFLRLIVKVNRTHESKRDDAMVVKYWFSDSTILGFHVTSPKFKLRNYHFFWASTLMWYYSTLQTFIQTNCRFKRPGCFVLRHWSLEIPDFCMTQHLADGQKMKALMWVKNITDFGRFCYSCLRINITLIFMSSSSE